MQKNWIDNLKDSFAGVFGGDEKKAPPAIELGAPNTDKLKQQPQE
jgi:hypothetical protein